MTKRRIIRADARNWAIQEWQEGGETIERGKFAGQEKLAKWKAPDAFFGRLVDAAKDMLNEEIGDNYTGQDLAKIIGEAEERITNHISSLAEQQTDNFLVGLLQERGYTVTNGKKGRSSYAEDGIVSSPGERNEP